MSDIRDSSSAAPSESGEKNCNVEDSSGENAFLPATSLSRRSFLAALGASATPMATAIVEAAETGYGAGGYGDGSYGEVDDDGDQGGDDGGQDENDGGAGDDDSGLSVTTNPPSNVTDEAATLNAKLDTLGGADAARGSFEISRAGSQTWYTTGRERLTAADGFSTTIDGLMGETAYEYRAVAESADGRDTGGVVSFTTEASEDAIEPVIERFSVTETGATDSHAELTVDWAVSHESDALDTVRITVYNEYGVPIAGPEIQVSGGEAADTEVITVTHDADEEYLITLVVTDAYGNITKDRELLDTTH